MDLLEKIATELDKAADYIENHERSDAQVKSDEASKIAAAEQAKREEVLAPIKSKLADLGEDEDAIEEKLKTASTESLEILSKGFTKESEEIVDDSWGNVEENKSSTGKFAGYKDPLEAFAMS